MNTSSNNMPATVFVSIDPEMYKAGVLFTHRNGSHSVAYHRADIVERLAEALEIIAGERQCIDNLMSNADVARSALAAYRESINDKA